MAPLASHHSPRGAPDFLGLRRSRTGVLEIVYDGGPERRMVWRVASATEPQPLSEALRAALEANRVLPALYCELKKRAIIVERVGGG